METFYQSSILRDIENLLKKDVKQRLSEVKKLSGRTKKVEKAFLSKLLDGLLDYLEAYDHVQSMAFRIECGPSKNKTNFFMWKRKCERML